MSNRENNKAEGQQPSTRRTPPRAVIHNADSDQDPARDQQPSAVPPPRNANRTASGVPELRMPSRDIATPKQAVIIDAQGRRLTVQLLTAMDRLNMYEAAGPKMSANQGWMGTVAVAISCIDIDGDKMPKPMSALEMKAAVARVEQDGLDAIQHVYNVVFGIAMDEGEDEAGALARAAKN